ncbi:TonB-dependent siderophore receptor [Sulfurospirillum cavolei]|uniref:TonB-dependent siderophore receptor n=1 Tax=Sulfurospirillum cavolei TaxID=366522 RepID=UPI000764AF29|nr:TonB-dependent receptor [Sulfurospirillum cavolei]
MNKNGLKGLSAILIPLLCATSVWSEESKDKTNVVLEGVVVSTERFQELEGGIADGFLTKEVSVGALGDKRAFDVPYQINTIPKEIIKNQRSQGLEDVIKYIPSAQIEWRGGADVGRPQTRGMRGDVVANSYWDGLHVVSTTATPMAMFDSLQILNGLSGSLYGAANPSGVYNFERKRPTNEYENSLLFTYGESGHAEAEADVGGRLNDKVGYRGVFVGGDGEGYVEGSNLRRQLISTGLDFYLTDRLTLETNFSYYKYIKEGYTGQFNMPYTALGVARYTLPDAYDASDEKYAQKNAGRKLTTTTYSGKLKYDIADNWYAEGGYLTQRADRALYGLTNTYNSNNGTYTSSVPAQTTATRFELDSYMAYIKTKQEILGFENDIAMGGNGYIWDIYTNKATGGRYISSTTDVKNLTLGDTIRFNDQWQTLVSVGKSWIGTESYNVAGVTTSDVSKQDYSYAASVIYQPIENLSLYVTYADSIQPGDSGTDVHGVIRTLDPYRSKQYEVGAKLALERIDLSTALFQIKRPTAYTGSDGVFEEQGEQTNKGVEFMASGKLTQSTAVFGGVTFMDTEISGAKIANINNKEAIGMPEWQANLLVEYTVPSFEELVLSSNFHYTGERAIDPANTQWADEYFTIDLSARYATKKLWGDRTIFRLSVNNITDEKYWGGIFASNGLDGNAASGSTSLFLGEPRNITASVEVRF